MHYPSNPLQPGPIYFLTPRKCTVFSVCCEAIPRQVFNLTDEAADCRKGANSIVSRLHHFFEHHGLGEKNVYLHTDNCKGQNKIIMLQYLMWRTMTGPAQIHHTVLFDCWSHQVFSGLVLWFVQTALSTVTDRLFQ